MSGLECVVGGCGRPHAANGWCSAHNTRMWRLGDVQADIPIRPPNGQVRSKRGSTECIICGGPVKERKRRTCSDDCMRAANRENGKAATRARAAKMKERTHCKHGHEFTPENTRTTKSGGRACRKCDHIASAKYRNGPAGDYLRRHNSEWKKNNRRKVQRTQTQRNRKRAAAARAWNRKDERFILIRKDDEDVVVVSRREWEEYVERAG